MTFGPPGTESVTASGHNVPVGDERTTLRQPWPEAAVAHTANDAGRRNLLVDHLVAVAELAREFADPLGAADEGFLAGLWHDLGKFSDDFQRYLRRCEEAPGTRPGSVDHKAAGARLAVERGLPIVGWLVHAHHGGLRSRQDFLAWLQQHAESPRVAEAWSRAAQEGIPLDPGSVNRASPTDPLDAELLIRLLFSALVDADSLDTEAHYRPELAAIRKHGLSAGDLLERFLEGRRALLGDRSDSVLDERRERIFGDCLKAAEHPPGIFRLTVPTGGGKTLSAMAFALRHARLHGLRRVVVAVPYITITEQTAGVYRQVFGDDTVVLEHHSGSVESFADGEEQDSAGLWHRLAAENWDAPIIVTTTVQLFESLFSNKRGRLRKAHRLARSVIILDEAQALPPVLLEPTLDMLVRLSRDYSTTVVLSTATQPAFDVIPAFANVEAREIVPGVADDFRAFSRVRYRWQLDSAVSWDEVASWVAGHERCLVVVNTRAQALELLEQVVDVVDADGVFHLSTLLCGHHRRDALERIRSRLAAGLPCRVVSTQVVEAGVDLDFPVVFRAVGPLDSVIQAAGRCNREGRLDVGEVVVFRPADGGMARGPYTQGAQITEALAADGLDLDDPATIDEYFRRWLEGVGPDARAIQDARRHFDFPQVARRFRMIPDDTVDVAVPYGITQDQLDLVLGRLATGSGGRDTLRWLQPYLVSLRRFEFDDAVRRGLATPVTEGLGRWDGPYDPVRGLVIEGFVPTDLVL